MPKTTKSSTTGGKKAASSASSSSKSAKAPAAKTAAKAPAPAKKPAPAKPAPAPASSKKPVAKAPPPPAKAPAKPPAAPAKPVAKAATPAKTEAAKPAAAAAAAPGAGAAGAKVPPKGITIVANRPMRKPKPKKLEMPVSEPLLKPGGKWKPLIPSGPKAPPTGLVGHNASMADGAVVAKNKLPKKELDKYREILLRKRAELLGDVNNMEDEALRQNSGSLSSLPQHMAEQGSDTSDQSIALDLAQVDRNLIREIDDALKRIDDGTYGVCLRTGQRISAERLAEIPWAKYSIEAQRELERRPYRE